MTNLSAVLLFFGGVFIGAGSVWAMVGEMTKFACEKYAKAEQAREDASKILADVRELSAQTNKCAEDTRQIIDQIIDGTQAYASKQSASVH